MAIQRDTQTIITMDRYCMLMLLSWCSLRLDRPYSNCKYMSILYGTLGDNFRFIACAIYMANILLMHHKSIGMSGGSFSEVPSISEI